jgi:class 3 adenylate cyclase/tetratricopeptide (TPR) repeat protein
MACGAALGLGEPPAALEERKVVTVLFCDLVGFTALAGSADPEDVKATLRPYHARTQQEIQRLGGTVEKFIGDAVMAVFGAPIAHEDDAERAVRSALLIVDAIEELNRVDPGLRLAVHIGVNTGEVVVTLDSEPHGHGLVAGDVVNMAARLQGVAPVGGVAVGEGTYRATRDLFDYEALAPVTVKGKREPVTIWRALAPRARYGSGVSRASGGLFVGRDDELELLKRTFARARREPSVQLVTIMGEPGVGKSRLVREFFGLIDDLPELVNWRQGRCLPFGEGITFWALGEIVKAQAGILDSDPPSEARPKLEAAVRGCLEDPDDRELVGKRLAPLVGLTPPDTMESAERSEYFAAWRRFLEAVAASRPTVLVIEDLIWADRALVEFLEYLVDWSSDSPMLVLCTARPELFEQHPGWGARKRNSTTITLSPLTDDEMTPLILALSSPSVQSPLVRDVIKERAEGNPLYAEELVAMLGERTAKAERAAEPAPAPENVQIGLPGPIHAIIAARLDALSPEQKQILQDASVVGKVFWSGALASMSGLDDRAVWGILHELGRKELVRLTRRSSVKDQVEYTFWHILIRDVAYGEIPRKMRARKHRVLAEWFQRIAGERVVDLAEIVAYHYRTSLELYRAAGGLDEAVLLEEPTRRALIIAGNRAFGLDVRRAGEHFRAALELFPREHPERIKVLAKAGETAARDGRFVESEKAYSEAIAGLRSQGDLLGAGDAMVKLSNVLWRRGETSRSRSLLEEAITTLEREASSVELANAYTEMAGNLAVLGDESEAVRLSGLAIAMARRVGVEDAVPRALGFGGAARCYQGDFSGLEDLREALDLALRQGLEREAARMRGLLAEFIWATEGPIRALEISSQGIELAEQRGYTDLAMAFQAETLGPLFDRGWWDELLRVADRVVRWALEDGERYFALLAQAQIARVMLHRGDVGSATSLSATILPLAREVGDPQVLVVVLAAAAPAELARDDRVAAVELIEEFERVTDDRPATYRAQYVSELVRLCVATMELDLADRLLKGAQPSSPRDALSVSTGRTVLEEARGNLESALGGYRDVADGWHALGFLLEEGEARLGIGRTLVQLGRPGAADAINEARRIFAGLDATLRVVETERWLDRASGAR